LGEFEIGVLALQGDFEAHGKALQRAGAKVREVRTAGDLDGLAGLVLPGGESTTMLKLLRAEQLFEPLRRFGEEKPIFGTCAGAILLATEVLHPAQESLRLVDMTIERNGYGRQADSRIAHIETPEGGSEAVFIRAPIVRRTGKDVEVLASYLDTPVLLRSGRHLIATFHPELSEGANIHRFFIENFAAKPELMGVKQAS
jgi:pyridoxal 5'-phosphate synthase pdxT subunit